MCRAVDCSTFAYDCSQDDLAPSSRCNHHVCLPDVGDAAGTQASPSDDCRARNDPGAASVAILVNADRLDDRQRRRYSPGADNYHEHAQRNPGVLYRPILLSGNHRPHCPDRLRIHDGTGKYVVSSFFCGVAPFPRSRANPANVKPTQSSFPALRRDSDSRSLNAFD